MTLLPEQMSALAHQQVALNQALSQTAIQGLQQLLALNLRYTRQAVQQFQQGLSNWPESVQPNTSLETLPGWQTTLEYGRELQQLSSDIGSRLLTEWSEQSALTASHPHHSHFEINFLPGLAQLFTTQGLPALPFGVPASVSQTEPAAALQSSKPIKADKPTAVVPALKVVLTEAPQPTVQPVTKAPASTEKATQDQHLTTTPESTSSAAKLVSFPTNQLALKKAAVPAPETAVTPPAASAVAVTKPPVKASAKVALKASIPSATSVSGKPKLKPLAKPAAAPVPKTPAKSVSKPASKAAAKPAIKPAVKPVVKPANKPVAQAVTQTGVRKPAASKPKSSAE